MANNLTASASGQLSGKERVALIMPVYNEAATIESTIKELYEKVASKMGNIDIWVFEDGSTDGTKEVLRKLAAEFPRLRVRMAAAKKGYPRAMREAFLSISPADYEYVVAIDSDGQYEPNDLFRLWRIMQRYAPDIVMGCRVVRREPLYRRFLSKGLQLLERMMFPLQCRDVTSVMRLMRVPLAQDVAKEVKYSPYNFWLEFTARMSVKRYSVIEVPIAYRARSGGSKVYSLRKMPKVVLSEFRALRAVKQEYNGKRLKQPNP
ncbi:MAG: glycosyltransferase family 2 protein [Candidatus Bathyarchaeota archaeon]|nr:glycosyltransferase family 2 protein [Candidatus Bathyarchaeota archaeon]